MSTSDGSTADYYQLPSGSTELQHLISHRDMNAQIGEIFRACYRYGIASHSSRMRDAKKIRFYIEAEISRLEALEVSSKPAFDWAGALAEQEASSVTGYDTASGADETRVLVVTSHPGTDWVVVPAEEPAAQIDDESDRQKAVEQNGNDGAVYEDPWYGAPEWARFKAQDDDGEWFFFSHKPTPYNGVWKRSDDLDDMCEPSTISQPATNWRDTLIERP